MRKYLPLLLILIFSFVFLAHKLDRNPPGFFIDESIYGFEASSILKTDGFSSNGEFLPRMFLNPGESIRNHSIFVYPVALSIAIFGNSEFSVRLTSVFFSIMIALLLFIKMRKQFPIAVYFGILWWPFTSWVFLLSRIGMEFIFCSFLFTYALLLIDNFIHFNLSVKNLTLFCLVCITLFFSYAAGKILAPGLLLIVFIINIFSKNGFNAKIRNVIFLAIVTLIIFLLSYQYVIDKSFFYRSDELMIQCKQSPVICFVQNIMSHFSWQSYFGNTYTPKDFPVITHSIPDTSLMPKIFIPFLLIGFFYVLKKAYRKNYPSLISIFLFLLATIPASLTIRGFDSYRSVAILPFLFIFSIEGFNLIFVNIQKLNKLAGLIFCVIIAISSLFFVLSDIQKMQNYEFNTSAASYSGWQFGYKEINDYIKNHYDDYDLFLISAQIGYLPNLYIRFYDPYQQLNKIQILSSQTIKMASPRTLFALAPQEANLLPNFHKQNQIFYLNQKDVAFILGTVY